MKSSNSLLVCCFISTFKYCASSDELTKFVLNKMANYSTWLKTNGFDPSPAFRGPSVFETGDGFTQLNISISNLVVHGYSDGMETQTGIVSFPSRSFETGMPTNGNINFCGIYEANGSVAGTIPICQQGRWFISVPYIRPLWYTIRFDSSPSGFLYIDSYNFGAIEMTNEHEVDFEGMWEDLPQYQNQIKESVFQAFKSWMWNQNSITNEPMSQFYLQYWHEILAVSTMEDIAGNGVGPKPEF